VEVSLMGEKKQIGVVTRYFHKIGVAAIMLEDSLTVGSKVSIEGSTTNFEQEVSSMQVNREDIQEGKKGQEIAIKVKDRVRENDVVYLM
jgi:putative protease